MSSTDLVGRFRLFENGAPGVSAEQSLVNYLHEYSDRPFVKDELLAKLEDMQNKGLKMRIRRMGKDLDDLHWHFGKIHGLENIAFAEEADLKAVGGDPIALQLLVNRLDGGVRATPSSFEEIQVKSEDKYANYKDQVSQLNLITSDRKKILSLPLYLSKRVQVPEPKRGQSIYDLFTSITGKTFNSDLFIDLDKETKITEFDFEKYLNPALLQRVSSQNDIFKNFVRNTNFFTNTSYEQLQEDKKKFINSTPVLAQLNPREQRELLHLINNSRGRSGEGQEEFEDIYTYLIDVCPQIETKMAEVSEEENFNLKNRYRHQWKTMNFADKKRMPIHESKVADLLRNSHIYRSKIVNEIGTYQKQLDKGD